MIIEDDLSNMITLTAIQMSSYNSSHRIFQTSTHITTRCQCPSTYNQHAVTFRQIASLQGSDWKIKKKNQNYKTSS